MEKKLFIISGCNGAGKTTAAITLLPTMFERTEFVNADNIARKLNPSSPGVTFKVNREKCSYCWHGHPFAKGNKHGHPMRI